jgi:hypothetical protein
MDPQQVATYTGGNLVQQREYRHYYIVMPVFTLLEIQALLQHVKING